MFQINRVMTLETANRIKSEGYVQGKDKRTYEQFMLMNKEAEAILRGGMNICETKEDGSRKYVWIKVKPTQTDNESSIDVAMKKYRRRKQSCSKMRVEQTEIRFQNSTVSAPSYTAPSIQHEESIEDEVSPLSQLTTYLKREFAKFVKTMDDMVEE